LIALAGVALCALSAAEQRKARPWTATLRDSQGVAIAGATVRVESGSVKAAARTGPDGRFTFPALEPGTYTIRAERDGEMARTPHPVQLSGNETALEWSAKGVLAIVRDTKSPQGTGGEQLSGKAVSELPLNKRDFSQLLLLAAGTMTDTNGASNFTQQFAVNGQRGTAAVFALAAVRRDSLPSSRGRGRTRSMARHSSSCATLRWTRAISSTAGRLRIRAASLHLCATSSE
jgi:hypothetical protein